MCAMTIRLYALRCGSVVGDAGTFAEGERGEIRLPVPSWLIEHPRGLALFDSGLHPDLVDDPETRLGPLSRVMRIELGADETIGARLAVLGVDPRDVRFLVTSHLHFDHVGGHVQVPNARLVVQRDEWSAGHDDASIRASFYEPRDYDLGHDVEAVEGEHDVFGDGRVVCLPTPGHTPGHQSLRVRLASGEVVLTADACYFRRTLEALRLPPFAHDFERMRASLERLRGLARDGARLLFGHDEEQWAGLPEAPSAVE
jgi:glyoxylase-like metal-dependent hydrolase (beta-lactamase superfamily II)